MKKLVMAAAVLGAFAGAAQAQTSVTLYGIADGNVRVDHTNIGTLKSIDSGGESGTRWGIRGTEDLGNGLKANFIFEQGFDLSDNASPQGNVGGGISTGFGGTSTAPHTSSGSRLFSRIATVGLAGPFGEVRFGRAYTPTFLNQATADPFGAGFVGEMDNIFVNLNARNDNGVYYTSPILYGLQFSGAIQLGESTTANGSTTQAKRGNDHYEYGLTYTNGPVYAGAAYEDIRSNVDNYRVRNYNAAATYDFTVVKLAAQFWSTRNTNPAVGASATAPAGIRLHEDVASVGATVPVGAWTGLAQFGYLWDKSSFNSGANYGLPHTKYVSAGFRYSFSKRTIVYGAWSRMSIKTGAQGQAYSGFNGPGDASNNGLYTQANLGTLSASGLLLPNVNPWSAQVGIRHSF